MQLNWYIIAATTLIPLLVGSVWYNPKALGKIWMDASGMTEEKVKQSNIPMIMGLSVLLGIFLAVGLTFMVIHQAHIFSVVMDEPALKDPNSELSKWLSDFMGQYGSNFRTFKHGAFHGLLGAVFVILPTLAVNALYELKGFKYILINFGYWAVSMVLMGGVICAYA